MCLIAFAILIKQITCLDSNYSQSIAGLGSVPSPCGQQSLYRPGTGFPWFAIQVIVRGFDEVVW